MRHVVHSTHAAAVAAALVLATGASALGQELETEIVAIDGSNGQTVKGTTDFIGIAANGDVLFDGSTASEAGFFVQRRAGGFDFLRTVGDVPSADLAALTGVQFVQVRSARIGSTGNAIVEALLPGNPAGEAFATLTGSTSLTQVATRVGLPGGCGYDDLFFGAYAYNGETFAFFAHSDSGICGVSRNEVVRRTGSGNFETVFVDRAPFAGVDPDEVDLVESRPPAVAPNGSLLFTATFRDDQNALQEVLFATPPAGGPVVVARTGTATEFGTSTSIPHYTFGPPSSVQPDSVPPIAYVLDDDSAGRSIAIADGAGAVSDVVSDGDGVGEFAMNLKRGGPIGISLCNDNRLIVTCPTIGPGLVRSTGNHGVWRYTPGDPGSLELLFVDGISFTDTADVERDVVNLHYVHVGAEGRVAVEFDQLSGRQTIAVERPSGGLTVVATDFEPFTATGDPLNPQGAGYQLVGAWNRNPVRFEQTGPGFDGRPSRFTPAGEFLFAADVDLPQMNPERRGLFIVSPTGGAGVGGGGGGGMLGSDLRVVVRRGRATIRGTDGEDSLRVEVGSDGAVRVIPLSGTTIAGSAAPMDLTGVRRIAIDGGPGVDDIEVVGTGGCEPQGAGKGPPRPCGTDLLIDMGRDSVAVRTFFGRNIRIGTGVGLPFGGGPPTLEISDTVATSIDVKLDFPVIVRFLRVSAGSSLGVRVPGYGVRLSGSRRDGPVVALSVAVGPPAAGFEPEVFTIDGLQSARRVHAKITGEEPRRFIIVNGETKTLQLTARGTPFALEVRDTKVAGRATVRSTGPTEIGVELSEFGAATFLTAAQVDRFNSLNSVYGRLTVRTGGGADSVSLDGSTVGASNVNLGPDDDELRVTDTRVDRARITGGPGDDALGAANVRDKNGNDLDLRSIVRDIAGVIVLAKR